MELLFKKLLVNILVLMVVMLPLRNVFAMSMTMSPDHCAVDAAELAMVMMEHAGHNMISSDMQGTQLEQKVACCNSCDGECTDCVHIASAIAFGFLQLSDSSSIEFIPVVSDLLHTRIISPPSRPPLTL